MGVVVGGEEVFLEQVGTEEFSVGFFEVAETFSFVSLQVPGGFEQEEAGFLQVTAVGIGELSDFLPTDLV